MASPGFSHEATRHTTPWRTHNQHANAAHTLCKAGFIFKGKNKGKGKGVLLFTFHITYFQGNH